MTAHPAVLLVEGPTDKWAVECLLHAHGMQAQFGIKEKGGIDRLLGTLEVELRASELERLGVIVDADAGPARRWQSLGDRLKKCGYDCVPRLPDPNGTVVTTSGKPGRGSLDDA